MVVLTVTPEHQRHEVQRAGVSAHRTEEASEMDGEDLNMIVLLDVIHILVYPSHLHGDIAKL